MHIHPFLIRWNRNHWWDRYTVGIAFGESFGVALGWIGNCWQHKAFTIRIAPGVVILTFREWISETTISFGWPKKKKGDGKYHRTLLPSIWWNSDQIAEKWGKRIEADRGVMFHYKGWLGNHWSV